MYQAVKLSISRISSLILITLITISFGCTKSNLPVDITDINDLVVPQSFNYETAGDLELSITDDEDMVTYQVYSYTSDEEPEVIYIEEDTIIMISNSNQLLTQGIIKNGQWTTKLNVPSHQKFIYLRRYADGAYSGEILEITGKTLSYNHTGGMKMKSGQSEDIIYTLNKEGNLGYFSTSDYTYHDMGKLKQGSRAIAVDKANNVIYYCGNNKQLIEYNISTGAVRDIMKLSLNYSGMDYRSDEGLIYCTYKRYTYTVDPFSGKYISKYKTDGHSERTQNDICFAPDETLYMAGLKLYSVKITGEKNKYSTILNPLSPTMEAAVYGSDGYIYAASKKEVYKINPANGDKEYLFDLPTDSDDFGIMVQDAQQANPDADGDGVPDATDEYPDDASRAFITWYPGENSFGTLAYEDLWPSRGDYDFNDMVIDYKFKQIKNADNLIVAIGVNFTLRAIGGSVNNGFGFQLDLDPELVSEVVSDYSFSSSDLSIASNGLENAQELATVIVFANGFKVLPHPGSGVGVNTNVNNSFVEPANINIEIKLNQAISADDIDQPPYNPFIFRTDERGREIHLPGYAPTDLADDSYFGTGNDATDIQAEYYYKTKFGLPWGMNLPVSFTYPLEKISITDGYLMFDQWAASGGFSYMDWYLDLTGYRSSTSLFIKD